MQRVGVGQDRGLVPAHVTGADRRSQDRRRAGAFDARFLLAVVRLGLPINSRIPPPLYSTARSAYNYWKGLQVIEVGATVLRPSA